MQDTENPESRQTAAPRGADPLTILIAEDDAEDRMLTTEARGFEIVQVPNA